MKSKWLRNGSYVFFFKLIGMTCGLLFNTLLVTYFGANDYTDALLVALIIPLGLSDDILRIVNMLVIPQIVKFKEGEPGRLWEFFISFVLSTGIVSLGVIILLWVFSAPLMGAVAPGFAPGILTLVQGYFIKSLGLLLLLSLNSTLQSLAFAEEKFFLPSLATAAYKVFSIAGLIVLHSRFGLDSVFFGLYAGAIIQAVILFPMLMRFVRNYAVSNRYSLAYLSPLVPALIPILIGSLAAHLNGMVGKHFASFLGAGAVTTLDMAQKIILVIPNLVVIPLSTAMFPSLARWIQAKDYEKVHDHLGSAIHTIILIAGAIMVLLVFYSQNVVTLLFGYGEFSQNAIRSTSDNLKAYGLGIIPICLNQIFYMILYLNRSILPLTIIGSLNVLVNFIGNSMMAKTFGAQGIADSTSLASWSICLTGGALIHHMGLLRVSRSDLVDLGKTFLSIAIATPLLFLIPKTGFIGKPLLAFGIMGVSFFVLLMPAFLLRIKSAEPIRNFFDRKRVVPAASSNE